MRTFVHVKLGTTGLDLLPTAVSRLHILRPPQSANQARSFQLDIDLPDHQFLYHVLCPQISNWRHLQLDLL